MKFICLGYTDPKSWTSRSTKEIEAFMDGCFAYDDVLRAGGHFAGGEGLQGPESAKTLWSEDGRVVVVDGPYAETKEQIGGILFLEARDMQHAVELMSAHPGVMGGPFEIRPAQDMSEFVAASEKRRANGKS